MSILIQQQHNTFDYLQVALTNESNWIEIQLLVNIIGVIIRTISLLHFQIKITSELYRL